MTPTISLPTLYQEALVSFASGKSADSVLNKLMTQGLPEPHARVVMTKAFQDKKAFFRKAGLVAMCKGAAFLALGIVVTALTFSMHMPVFIVATGPILFGVVTFFKGMFRTITG